MSKIYIVTESDTEYESDTAYTTVRGVFSTKPAAINHLRECQENYARAIYCVQEWEIDGARSD